MDSTAHTLSPSDYLGAVQGSIDDAMAAFRARDALSKANQEERDSAMDTNDGSASPQDAAPPPPGATGESSSGEGVAHEAPQIKVPPHTLNPKPETHSLEPSTLNPQPSTLNPQPFTPKTPNTKTQTSNLKHQTPNTELQLIKVVGICCFGMSLVGVGPDGGAVTPIYTSADARNSEARATVHPSFSTLNPNSLSPPSTTLSLSPPFILHPKS